MTWESCIQAASVEERIRAKAYELWQEDGSMEGCADEYWRRARHLVEAELADEQRLRGNVEGAADRKGAGAG
ncbi:DUF2934 domain-containing protein [Paraburkholderia phytofirmans]|uniref:DUF2934 domain-containing protein n=1 Tax=Paraburkholderia phytofirmans TaxID=261302 RepID=UPI0038BC4E05